MDIGYHSIKVIQLQQKRGLIRLASYNSVRSPKDPFSKNALKNTDELAKSLKEALASAKIAPITSRFATIAIPEYLTFTKISRVPKMGTKELSSAIKWEVEQSIPVSIEELYYDFEVINQNKDSLDVLIAAAPKSLIESYMEVLNKAGIEAVALEIEPQAVSRALIKKNDAQPYLIADIGAQTTSITIFDQKAIQFTASALIGGNNINKSLETKLGKNSFDLDQLLTHPESHKNKEVLLKAFEATKPTVNSIATEINKTVRYYEEQSKKKVSKVLVCGGEAILPGLTSFIENSTSITTKIGNPWVNLPTFPLKPIPHEELPSYATAIGLALREYV